MFDKKSIFLSSSTPEQQQQQQQQQRDNQANKSGEPAAAAAAAVRLTSSSSTPKAFPLSLSPSSNNNNTTEHHIPHHRNHSQQLQQPPQWQCINCNNTNNHDDSTCKSCFTERELESDFFEGADREAAESLTDNNRINNIRGAQTLASSSSSEEKSAEDLSADFSSTAASTFRQGFDSNATDVKWKCSVCCIKNPADVVKCLACETHRDSAAAAAASKAATTAFASCEFSVHSNGAVSSIASSATIRSGSAASASKVVFPPAIATSSTPDFSKFISGGTAAAVPGTAASVPGTAAESKETFKARPTSPFSAVPMSSIAASPSPQQQSWIPRKTSEASATAHETTAAASEAKAPALAQTAEAYLSSPRFSPGPPSLSASISDPFTSSRLSLSPFLDSETAPPSGEPYGHKLQQQERQQQQQPPLIFGLPECSPDSTSSRLGWMAAAAATRSASSAIKQKSSSSSSGFGERSDGSIPRGLFFHTTRDEGEQSSRNSRRAGQAAEDEGEAGGDGCGEGEYGRTEAAADEGDVDDDDDDDGDGDGEENMVIEDGDEDNEGDYDDNGDAAAAADKRKLLAELQQRLQQKHKHKQRSTSPKPSAAISPSPPSISYLASSSSSSLLINRSNTPTVQSRQGSSGYTTEEKTAEGALSAAARDAAAASAHILPIDFDHRRDATPLRSAVAAVTPGSVFPAGPDVKFSSSLIESSYHPEFPINLRTESEKSESESDFNIRDEDEDEAEVEVEGEDVGREFKGFSGLKKKEEHKSKYSLSSSQHDHYAFNKDDDEKQQQQPISLLPSSSLSAAAVAKSLREQSAKVESLLISSLSSEEDNEEDTAATAAAANSSAMRFSFGPRGDKSSSSNKSGSIVSLSSSESDEVAAGTAASTGTPGPATAGAGSSGGTRVFIPTPRFGFLQGDIEMPATAAAAVESSGGIAAVESSVESSARAAAAAGGGGGVKKHLLLSLYDGDADGRNESKGSVGTVRVAGTEGVPGTTYYYEDGTEGKESALEIKLMPEKERTDEAVGVVYTWGSGECDQLALNSRHLNDDGAAPFPLQVHKLRNHRVFLIACGALHTAALLADGVVVTWGCNDDGSLGRETGNATLSVSGQLQQQNGKNGTAAAVTTMMHENVPARVRDLPPDDPVKWISCGDSHTAALTVKGKCFAWGTYKDNSGYIGFPCFKSGKAAAGSHKQNGQQHQKKTSTPTLMESITGNCVRLVSGENHTAVITVPYSNHINNYNNDINSRNDGNYDGDCDFGINDEDNIAGNSSSSSNNSSWGVVGDGKQAPFTPFDSQLFVFGSNEFGQLFHHVSSNDEEQKLKMLYPTQVHINQLGLSSANVVTNVFCGKASTFIEVRRTLTKDDNDGDDDDDDDDDDGIMKTTKGGGETGLLRYYAVGRNSSGELGGGSSCPYVESPQEIREFRGVHIQDIQGCQFSSVALTAEGRVYSWGKHDYLGQGAQQQQEQQQEQQLMLSRTDENGVSIPKELNHDKLGSDVTSIGCGSDTTFAIKSNGRLYAWGDGQMYQIGNGLDYLHLVKSPVVVPAFSLNHAATLAVSAGAHHSVALVFNNQYLNNAGAAAATAGVAATDEQDDAVCRIYCCSDDAAAAAGDGGAIAAGCCEYNEEMADYDELKMFHRRIRRRNCRFGDLLFGLIEEMRRKQEKLLPGVAEELIVPEYKVEIRAPVEEPFTISVTPSRVEEVQKGTKRRRVEERVEGETLVEVASAPAPARPVSPARRAAVPARPASVPAVPVESPVKGVKGRSGRGRVSPSPVAEDEEVVVIDVNEPEVLMDIDSREKRQTSAAASVGKKAPRKPVAKKTESRMAAAATAAAAEEVEAKKAVKPEVAAVSTSAAVGNKPVSSRKRAAVSVEIDTDEAGTEGVPVAARHSPRVQYQRQNAKEFKMEAKDEKAATGRKERPAGVVVVSEDEQAGRGTRAATQRKRERRPAADAGTVQAAGPQPAATRAEAKQAAASAPTVVVEEKSSSRERKAKLQLEGAKTEKKAAAAERKTTGTAGAERNTTGTAGAEKKPTGTAGAEKKLTGTAGSEKKTTGTAAEKKTPGTAAVEKKTTGTAAAAVAEKKATGTAVTEKKPTVAAGAEKKTTGTLGAEKKTTGALGAEKKPTGTAGVEKKTAGAAGAEKKIAGTAGAEKKPAEIEIVEKKRGADGRLKRSRLQVEEVADEPAVEQQERRRGRRGRSSASVSEQRGPIKRVRKATKEEIIIEDSPERKRDVPAAKMSAAAAPAATGTKSGRDQRKQTPKEATKAAEVTVNKTEEPASRKGRKRSYSSVSPERTVPAFSTEPGPAAGASRERRATARRAQMAVTPAVAAVQQQVQQQDTPALRKKEAADEKPTRSSKRVKTSETAAAGVAAPSSVFLGDSSVDAVAAAAGGGSRRKETRSAAAAAAASKPSSTLKAAETRAQPQRGAKKSN